MINTSSKAHEIQETIGCIQQALINSECRSQPYPYWQLSGLFPEHILKQLQDLSLPHFDYNEGYGARNIYNKYRHYLAEAPLLFSELLLNNSTTVNNNIDNITRMVATASIVGLICSLRPVNICHGRVF